MNCEEYATIYNKKINECLFDLKELIKQEMKKNDNMFILSSDDNSIVFEIKRNTSIMSFYYIGKIVFLDNIGLIGAEGKLDKKVINGLSFFFRQRDTGNFDTSQLLEYSTLTPPTKELKREGFYYEGIADRKSRKTSSINTFVSRIKSVIKEYCKD